MVKFKSLFWEIFRFGIVGGVCFVIDSGIFMFLNNIAFNQPAKDPNEILVILANAAGFIAGVLSNYLLSRCFVFTTEQQKKNGAGKKSFIIFITVSFIGFLLSEFLVWLFYPVLELPDILAKIISAAIVMIWNYIGRKVFIFK